MRILVAPDSFKGSASQHHVASALEHGLHRGWGDGLEVERRLMADGGEGTTEIFLQAGAIWVPVPVHDAYGRLRTAGWARHGALGIVEAAQGSPYVSPPDRPARVRESTSQGTGELLQAALNDEQVSEVWVALGGSGCIDGGMGLLEALGAEFHDAAGRRLTARVENWGRVERVALPTIQKPVVVLADAWVPLLGSDGALQLFGPQKGLAIEEARQLEPSLGHFASRMGTNLITRSGAGAAGGMGMALAALGAQLVPGAEWIADWIGLPEALQRADVVVTGEGRLDRQSLVGKAVGVVLDRARKAHVPAVVVAGSLPDELDPFYQRGLSVALSLGREPRERDQAMANTVQDLEAAAETLGRMLRMCRVMGRAE